MNRRSKELQESLRRELESADVRALSPSDRRVWLLDQLDNYLDRWLAFAALGVPIESLLRDDLFSMLVVGVDRFSEELKLDHSAPEAHAWSHFVAQIELLKSSRSVDVLNSLRADLTQVRNERSRKPG